MKRLIMAMCFTLAVAPCATAQEKAKDAEKKPPVAAEKSVRSDASKVNSEEKKSDASANKSAKKELTEKQRAQHARMKECAEKAGDRKGDDRKKFMSACLKGEEATAAKKDDRRTAQQAKMSACNREAKDKSLKGDERKKFISECLSKS